MLGFIIIIMFIFSLKNVIVVCFYVKNLIRTQIYISGLARFIFCCHVYPAISNSVLILNLLAPRTIFSEAKFR